MCKFVIRGGGWGGIKWCREVGEGIKKQSEPILISISINTTDLHTVAPVCIFDMLFRVWDNKHKGPLRGRQGIRERVVGAPSCTGFRSDYCG
jgi:hypothetical protein